MIELIRENRIEEALAFASEHLAERGEEDPMVLDELERTLALLAFEDPAQSPFGDLLSSSHRQKVRQHRAKSMRESLSIFSLTFQVASELNAAILKSEHAEQTQPKLAIALKALLWSQGELDKKRIRYNRMVDLATGRTEDSK